jgi:peptide-methionine (R)-S-oxide reductase
MTAVAGSVTVGCRPASGPASTSTTVGTTTKSPGNFGPVTTPDSGQAASQGANVPGIVEATMSTNSNAPSDGKINPSTQAPRVEKTDAQWRAQLTPQQYHVLREKGTERAFTGKLWDTPPSTGEYRCAACEALLFRGKDKFVSDCGWPAFDKAIKGSITYHADRSFGMTRTEVTCSRCDGHLGHVFEDGPTDTTGIRYCINSASITYTPVKDEAATKDLATEAIVEPKE